MNVRIPFNKPALVGREMQYLAESVERGHISSDGYFTQRCAQLLEDRLGIKKVLLTPSCTAALELAAMLSGFESGDEVILPSFTFVSTANAFVRLGVRPVFVDIRPDTLNLDETKIAAAITPRTKAICPVHYAGVGCEMDAIMQLASQHGLMVIEDAAQAVNATYRGRCLGAIGQLAAFSFHETKNFICGEGGALCLNRTDLVERAEILRQKGTNRNQFLRGQVDKYTWVDVGSSYVPSELTSAFLLAQLECMDAISARRRAIYERYRVGLSAAEQAGLICLPRIPADCGSNFHLFHLLLADQPARDGLLDYLRSRGIGAVFHYVPLHTSPMGMKFGYRPGQLPVTECVSGRLIRLPFFYDLASADQDYVIAEILAGVLEPVG